MSEERAVYSIQQTYIIKLVSKSKKRILTCDERIDIPTIEPLMYVEPVFSNEQPLTVVPCVEIMVLDLDFPGLTCDGLDFTFETNEGVTVLPVKIRPGSDNSIENPYLRYRYVLVLPRGTTGIKTCKITASEYGQEIQHNFTFGVMPPPYNYDNMLFGYLTYTSSKIAGQMKTALQNLSIGGGIYYTKINLPKNVGKQTISISDGQLFFDVFFNYPLSPGPTIHKPKITLHGVYSDPVYTLSLNKTANIVSIDLLTGMITAYDRVNGEIIQQFMLELKLDDITSISFENFDDIDTSYLEVRPSGVSVK